MSRRGSMTRPTPCSSSMTAKLALPSSGAGIASTVNISERDGGEEHPDRDERDEDRTAVKDDLCGHALGGVDTEVDQQVAQAMREMKERQRDQHQQVELDKRIAKHADPRVVVPVDDGHDAEGAKDALDQDVHRQKHSRDHPTLGEEEPPDEVHERRALSRLSAHRANQMSTNAMTADATAHNPNIASVISPDGRLRSRTLTRMISPERLRKVTLW